MTAIEIRRIREASQSYKQELTGFCQKLIRTRSVNGVDKEEKIAKLIASKAKKLGLSSKLIALDSKRPNVFVGSDFGKKSGLLLIAHLDTVPEGERSQWKHDPFRAKIEAGKLFGRGAIDCKSGIALSLYALKILKDLGKSQVAKFAAVVDEESGADSKLGARFLLDKGLKAKAAIYTYPGVDVVTIGHRGLVRLWIKIKGEAAHTGSKSWQDGVKGASTIEALAKFIDALLKIRLSGTHKAFPGFAFKHTPTLIEGGSGESIVPDKAKLLVDARLLPNQDNEKYIKQVESLASKFETDKIKFEIKVKTSIPGVAISRNEPIVKLLQRLAKEVMNVTPELRGAGPASEGYMFVKEGIPTICGFGAVGDGVHSANEYVEIESLPKILEIYARAALELS